MPTVVCSHVSLYVSIFYFQYDWYTKKTSVVVDVVKRPGEGKQCLLVRS